MSSNCGYIYVLHMQHVKQSDIFLRGRGGGVRVSGGISPPVPPRVPIYVTNATQNSHKTQNGDPLLGATGNEGIGAKM